MFVKPKLWTKEYVIVSLVNFLTVLNFFMLMTAVAGYSMNKFHSSPGEAGFIVSIFVIGAIVARLFTGKWIARVGYKRMLVIGVIACVAATLLYFKVTNVLFLLVVRLCHGAAFGMTATSAATIIADIVPGERRGEGIGYHALSQTLATSIGPFIGIFLSRQGSYSAIFSICAGVSAIGLAVTPFISLRKMEITEEQRKGMRGFKLDNFIESRVIPVSIVNLIMSMAYASIVCFLSVYSKEIKLVNAAGFFFIVYPAAVLFSRPFVGRLFDVKGENSVMYPAILLFSGGLFLLSQSYYGYALLCAAVFVGFGFGTIQCSTQAIAAKISPRHRLGQANSTYFMFLDMGMFLGPLLVGFMIPVTGFRNMYMVVAGVVFLCVLLYYLLHGKTANSLPIHRFVL